MVQTTIFASSKKLQKKLVRQDRSNLAQSGLSLIELLIGMTAGLVVVGGSIALVVSILASNSDAVQASRLSNDLNKIMAIMATDIRRAGYTGTLLESFQSDNNTSADPRESLDITSTCIHYTYGTDGGARQDNGFRFDADNKKIEMTSSKWVDFSCDDFGASTWQSLNDSDEILITAFTIADHTQCLDSDGAAINCTDSGARIAVRELDLKLSGQVANDAQVQMTVEQSVRIRNNQSFKAITPP